MSLSKPNENDERKYQEKVGLVWNAVNEKRRMGGRVVDK